MACVGEYSHRELRHKIATTAEISDVNFLGKLTDEQKGEGTYPVS